jgi:hypothetical protein
LNDGTLSVQIVLDGKPRELQPWEPPVLLPGKSHETTIVHDNHSYTVRYGITADVYKEIGTRLIYGGKWFCTDARPTGQFSTKRFYSEIRIPKSVGFDVMQTTKEAVSFAKMKHVFQKCMDVFLPLLEEADGLARNEADQELADRLSDRLSVAYRRPKPQVELGEGEKRYAVSGGLEDLRNVENRDPDGIGVEPQNTGIKRRGRKRPGEAKAGQRRVPKRKVITPDAITTQYHELEGSELARFDYGTGVLHINEANANTRRLYEAGKAGDDVSEVKLAIIGAAAVARGVEGNDPSSVQLTMGFKETSFDLVFAEMIARMEG